MYVRSARTWLVAGAVLSLSLAVVACTAVSPPSVPPVDDPSITSSLSPSALPAAKTGSPNTRCRERARDPKYREFIPPTTRERGEVVVPLVFPDGSSAELVYPPRLRLAQLGVQPAVSVGIERDTSRFLHERFLMITKTPLRGRLTSGDEPVEVYRGPTGKVTVWQTKDKSDLLYPIFMHFRIGSWNVIVGDGNAGTFMGRENRRVWAGNLAGYETASGFPVPEPRPPLAFATGSGLPDIYLSTCSRFLELRLGRCADLAGAKLASNQTARRIRGVTVQQNQTGGTFGANWCTSSRQLSVYVTDRSERFVDRVVEGLRVRNVSRNREANYSDS